MIKNVSNWVKFCTDQIHIKKKNKTALDLACGKGRHSIFLSKLGYTVIALDINMDNLNNFKEKNILKLCCDIENFIEWPFAKNSFDLVVVTNFLNRRIFNNIKKVIKINGYIVYETFGIGHENFGKPKNKDYLLRKNELVNLTKNFQLIIYEEIKVLAGNTKFIKHRIVCKNV